MARNRGTRQFAIMVAFLPSQHVLALPQVGTTVPSAPPAWVAVDASGVASTITPAVVTTQGQRATVLKPPASLLSTATYTLSPDGHASTYTGLVPVASATGDGDAGVFLACTTNQGVNEPFCLPKSGSTLHPGRTYYITWSPSYFSPPTTLLQLQALLPNFTTGFTSPQIPASTGFYAWHVPPTFLSSLITNPQQESTLTLTFLLSYPAPITLDSNTNTRYNRTGPTVLITPSDTTDNENKGNESGVNIPAIAIPLALVFGLLFLLGLAAVCYRRCCMGNTPTSSRPISTLFNRLRGKGGGYGIRQSRAERVVSTPDVGGGGQWGGAVQGVRGDGKSETEVEVQGIELVDRVSWSPRRVGGTDNADGGRRNVFREEVERQARLG